jgi:hypothetical protein
LFLLFAALSLVSTAVAQTTPTGFKAWPKTTTRIAMSWTPVSPADGYRIERSPDGSTGWTQIAQVTPATVSAYTDGVSTPLVTKTKYHYRIRSYQGASNSSYSAATWAITVYTGYPLYDWVNVTVPNAECVATGVATPGDSTDDTEAIQCFLDKLGANRDDQSATPKPQHVLYFPNGEYILSDKPGSGYPGTGLALTRPWDGGVQGLQLVAETPGGVTFKWKGCVGADPDHACVMFRMDGSSNTTLRGFVWDGNRAGNLNYSNPDKSTSAPYFVVAFDESSRLVGSYESGAAHFDSIFKNAWIGLRIGHYQKQNSELTLRRDQFLANAAGISIEDWNALNVWIWDGKFDANRYGVTNAFFHMCTDFDFNPDTPAVCPPEDCSNLPPLPPPADPTLCYNTNIAAGGFHVMRGRFSNNSMDDIAISNTGQFTIRDSWSTGSGRFFESAGSGANCSLSFIKNRISNCAQPYSVALENQGAMLMLDNEITSSGPPVYASSFWRPTPSPPVADVLSIQNRFSYVGTPSSAYYAPDLSWQRLNQIEDVTSATLPTVQIPAMPTLATDPLKTRPVYTVTDGNNLQQVINEAAAAGAMAVHLPSHVPSSPYLINSTIVIPANAHLIIAGNGATFVDGSHSVLKWTSTSDPGPIIRIDGYQAAGLTLRDLALDGNNKTANGIRVLDLNQDNSRVVFDRTMARIFSSAPDAGFVLDGIDRTSWASFDGATIGDLFGGQAMCQCTPGSPPAVFPTGTRVQAGPQPQALKAVWTGGATGNWLDFDVVNSNAGVQFLVTTHDMEESARMMRVRGGGANGNVSFHSTRDATKCLATCSPTDAPLDVFQVEDYTGNFSVIDGYIFAQENFDTDGNPQNGCQSISNMPPQIAWNGIGSPNIQSLGNSEFFVADHSSNLDPPGPFRRLNNKVICTELGPCGCGAVTVDPMTDIYTPASDADFVKSGVALLKNNVPPPFYDETNGAATYQVNLDHVLVQSVRSAIVLSGGIPPPPTTLAESAANTDDKVDLTWSNPANDGFNNEDQFVARRRLNGGSIFTEIGSTGPDATTFADTSSLGASLLYDYQVLGRRARTGDSATTNTITVRSAPVAASTPNPPNNSVNQLVTSQLSWNRGAVASLSDGYFGTNQSDVTNATSTNVPSGVLTVQGTAATVWAPISPLAGKTTYYWRIDTVDTYGGVTKKKKGAVWKFKTR